MRFYSPVCCFRPKSLKECDTKIYKPYRLVEPFSISSFYQKNVKVYSPSKLNVFEERNVNSSLFRTLLLRGDIPCQRSFGRQSEGKYLMWKISPEDLDYCYFLPVFFDGLCEPKFPFNVLACYAVHDLLSAGSDKILPVIPQLIIPIKNALNTKNPRVMASTLRVLQHMCMCDSCIGQALVPYYRQILPVLNIFYGKNVNLKDRIDFDRVGNLGDLIEQTLVILERCGGKNAYINIKFCIPTYESSVNN